MAKEPKAFLKIKRENLTYRAVCERIADYKEVFYLPSLEHSQEQATRCMDCGTPFCHWGCPIANYIPEWNSLIAKNKWDKAYQLLSSVNSLPEVTGRVCPAICEYACVLGVNDDPVTIREDELAIAEEAFKNNLIKPNPPAFRTGKKVAIIGSGPAGLTLADQLNKAGHTVSVFERDQQIGGILRYGIPDFKLDKTILERRINIFQAEGINFITKVNVGVEYSTQDLLNNFDAIGLALGCRKPRDISLEGRELKGIHFAMDYLTQSNKCVAKEIDPKDCINAKDKRVVVIGGGDTGSDCVGTAHRQGAKCVVQIEVMPKPNLCRTSDYPWPKYPLILKTSTSHQEGGQRQWAVLTKKFIGDKGLVKKIVCTQVEFQTDNKNTCPVMKEIPNSEFEIEADLVIIAVGFIHPEKEGLLTQLGVEFDQRGNVKTNQQYMSSVKKVFAAGDVHRGQSLVVWAISEGKQAAYFIDRYLSKNIF